MELKKEDFVLVTTLNGVKVLGLRSDYFDEKSIAEVVKEAMELKEEVEIVIEEEPKPTEEELEIKKHLEEERKLAEIEKKEKRAKLKAQLAALD